MNLVDSSGWLEYLGEGKNADFFSLSIQDIAHLIVPTICVYKVFKRMISLKGDKEALRVIGVMAQGHIVELNSRIAIDAAKFSLNFKLALADSVIFATARAYNATLWTEDEHFKNLEGVRYIEKK